ncbi:MAG: hypothetical protein IJV25_03305 [Prevotella sp.]|nr:hypothetical protein [Prevotella sp.]
MVSVQVDEAELREMQPEIDSMVAVRVWVQKLVDSRLQQMRAERGRNASQVDLWHAIEQDPDLLLKPSVIDEEDNETVDLMTCKHSIAF